MADPKDETEERDEEETEAEESEEETDSDDESEGADDDEEEASDEDEGAAQDDDADNDDADDADEDEADDADDDDDDADDEEEEEAPKPKAKAAPNKKAKKKAQKTAAGGTTPVRRSREAAPPEEDEGGNQIMYGVAIVAAIAVGIVWYVQRGSGSQDAPTADLEGATDNGAAVDTNPTPGAPPGMPNMPSPPSIPAPPDVAAAPEDAQRTESGLASRVLQAGTGDAHPAATDRVTVHYTGWTTDGQMFDSSVMRGQPATFALNRVIPGWTEGVQLMVVGEKRRFWIPANLAYEGRRGPQGTLVFDVELVSFETPPPPPPAPPDVAAIPSNAQTTESGLATRVLQPGTGTEHPAPTARVSVHYTGWTTDGEMFDSSVVRGSPATFGVNQVIPGWSEAVQLMVVGEKRRMWIPENLAYGGRPGAPAGMLVFDVELLEILPTPTGMPGMPPGHPSPH